MAEEKKSGKAQAFLMAHFEKLALGVSIAALIVWLALSMTSSNPEMEKAKKILANSGNEPPPAGPPVGPGASETFLADARAPWERLGEKGTAKEWTTAYATTIKPTKKAMIYTMTWDTVEVPVMLDVSLQDSKPSLEGVPLSWTTEEPPPPRKVPLNKKKGEERIFVDAGVDHYLLERKEKGAEKWEKHAEIPGGTSSFNDEKVDPVTEYEYRITPVTANEAIKEKKGKTSNEVAVTTLNVYDLKILNASMGKVFLRVTKHVIGVGPVSKTFNYAPNDIIGSDPRTKLFVHAVKNPNGGPSVKVDFNTGYKILSIKDEKLTLERMRCQPVIDMTGEQADCNRIKESRDFPVKVLAYVDAKKREHRVLDRDPAFEDQIGKCQIHKPAPVVVEEEGEEAEKEDPKTLEEQAAALLTEARTLLTDGKNKDALAAYQRLQGEFGNTTTFNRNKTEIESRISQLK